MLYSTVSYIYIAAFPAPSQVSMCLGHMHDDMALHMQMQVLLQYCHGMNCNSQFAKPWFPIEHDLR